MGIETGTALLIASVLTAATVAGTTIASSQQAKKQRTAVAGEAGKGRAALGAIPAAAKTTAVPETDASKLAKRSPSRLALIATSPRGVLGSAPVGRRKILGN